MNESRMKRRFTTSTTGKWILLGEHAVIRGAPALVFPLESLKLEFSFEPNDLGDIKLELSGKFGSELDLLFWGVLEKSCAMTGLRRSDLSGLVKIKNDIPVGAGLGASAAFCVAFARWFSFEGFVPEADIDDFARELENLFHGESSGLDVAVASSGRPLKFQRGTENRVFNLKWKPKFYLSYTGQRGVTRECVAKVKELWGKDKEQGERLDAQMKSAVLMAEKSLSEQDESGEALLLESLDKAASCFESWGLFEGAVEKHAKKLRENGALAVKPTGSGGGGYLLSYWKTEPPSRLLESGELIPCFRDKN